MSEQGALGVGLGFDEGTAGKDRDSGPAASLIAVRISPEAPRDLHESPATSAAVDGLLIAAGLEGSSSGLRLSLVGEEQHVVEFYGNAAGAVLIGRDWETVDLVCSDPSVSRRHARVRLRESGEPVVEDLASSNGTWIERRGQRIAVPAGRTLALEHGDRLGTSDDVVLARVDIREAP